MYMLLIYLACITIAFIPYIISNCSKKINEKQPEEERKKKSLSLEEKQKSAEKNNKLKAKMKNGSKSLNISSKTKITKKITEQKPITIERTEKTQENEDLIGIKKDQSLGELKKDSKKADNHKNPKCKIEETEKFMDQQELLPEIKEGEMKIADCDDPKYKTLYIFMDKNIDIFGPDKWRPGQCKIGTTKKISDDEFAARIGEIKAQYGAMMKADERIEINWDALFEAKNIETEGNALIFTLPAEVVSKVKKRKKRKKK